MERLTERIDGGISIKGCRTIYPETERKSAPMQSAIARLGKYEDTGLTPEEIMALIPLPNDPLTLDELREMSLHDWLWIEILIPSSFKQKESCYYCKFADYGDEKSFWCGWPGTVFAFDYVDYGKTWVAYHHKPENVQ